MLYALCNPIANAFQHNGCNGFLDVDVLLGQVVFREACIRREQDGCNTLEERFKKATTQDKFFILTITVN